MGHCFFIHFCLLYKSLKKKLNKFNSYYMYMYKEPFLFCCCFFFLWGVGVKVKLTTILISCSKFYRANLEGPIYYNRVAV